MKLLTPSGLREMWLKFFEEKNHKNIGSASLIPENDATVLFTTAGMHPLVPYLLGEKHPQGNRLTNHQKCLRTNDIDEVGDKSHLTLFEMLGNWSLGDYFKEDMIKWSFEFLTSEDYLGIPKDRLAVTVFAGDEVCPRDELSASIWKSCGLTDEQVFYLGKEDNWWALGGGVGPCGPDTEMYFDNGQPKCCDTCGPSCNCGKYLEIWNDVFMQYTVKEAGQTPVQLSQKNVDTGMGLERVMCVLNGVESVYDTELFAGAIKKLEELSGKSYKDEKYTRAFRIICDHMRTATFVMGDQKGIAPSNVGQGYVLRRLIRRSINYARTLEFDAHELRELSKIYIEYFKNIYPELKQNEEKVLTELDKEVEKFSRTITSGYKEFEKTVAKLTGTEIDGVTAFRLYDTFGFPFELTKELATERGLTVKEEEFKLAFEQHQQKSRAGAEQAFKGGLSDTGEATAKLHTATHLLLGALRHFFGDHIEQRGSNITPERLRFDFNFERKLLPEDLKLIEDRVNEAISKAIDVTCKEMTVEEAKADGAVGIFDSKYGNLVKVYNIEGYDKEICGGPHAKNTADLHHFKIVKEESSSAGVRRIKAILD